MARNNVNSRSPKQSLQNAISSNLRFITLFRIVLAFFVLYSHSFPIFLAKPDVVVPIFWKTSISFGTLAVGGFFCLSGLLLYNSASNLSFQDWLKRRALRLFPAYAFCLLFCSFVIAPIASLLHSGSLDGYLNFGPTGPFGYFWNNLFMPIGITYSLNDTFVDSPYGIYSGASVVNGSIWSLPYEIRCYFVIAIISYVFSSRMRDRLIPVFASLAFLGYLNSSNPAFQKIVGPLWIFRDSLFLQLLTVFLIGACFGVYSKKIFLSHGLLICLFLIYFLSTFHAKLLSTIGISTLGLIPFVIAVKIPKRLFSYPVFTWDISYGFYLFSFPIQQLMVVTFPDATFRTLLLYSTVLTGIIAAFSFKLLEAPMIQFGKRRSFKKL